MGILQGGHRTPFVLRTPFNIPPEPPTPDAGEDARHHTRGTSLTCPDPIRNIAAPWRP